MEYLTGKSASPGLCSGNTYMYRPAELIIPDSGIINPEKEIKRLKDAYSHSIKELSKIKSRLTETIGGEYGHIFRAQMTIIEDDDFFSDIVAIISGEGASAERALEKTFKSYVDLFSSLEEDDYNRQRLSDLDDVYKRILRNLLGHGEADLSNVPKGSIIVAKDLLPSDTALMNRENIEGIITEKGGVTSHVAILSKTIGIPAAVGVEGAVDKGENAGVVLLDTRDLQKARIWFNPDAKKLSTFLNEKKIYQKKIEIIYSMKDLEPVTLDGKRIELSANIGSISDLESAVKYGAKSVGLLRTEFFFLGTDDLPDEERQFSFYKEVAARLNPGMVIIRTIDIGGDKDIKCLPLPVEKNPFLGLRGIRVCLEYKDMFKTQLRALMRAAVYGNIKVMFPMLTDITELTEAKLLMSEASAELKAEGVEFNSSIEIGIMIETPSAVFISDLLTKECDFVSVGTNDLTQYILCADRINENVGEYYRVFSPSVFRALKITIENSHLNKRWTGVCGELAGIPMAIPILIGLGIDELSMTGQFLPESVAIIRSLNYEDCKKAAKEVLQMKTEAEIKALLQSRFLNK